MTDESPARTDFTAAATLTAVVLASYTDALGDGFVLDDRAYVIDNPALADPSSWWRLFVSSVHGDAAIYRPLSHLTFAIDRMFFGVFAPGYHAVNIAWHLLATLFVHRLSVVLTSRSAVALAAALLFASHPVHTEAVTSIVGRTEVMATVFVLVALLAHVRDRWALAAFAYLAALLSKESGVTVPLLALTVDLARGAPFAKCIRRAIPYTVPLGAYAAMRLHALHGAPLPDTTPYFHAWSRWSFAWSSVDNVGRALSLLAWPHSLSADYSYRALSPSSGPWSPFTFATLVSLAALCACAVVLRARSRWPGALLAMFLLAYLPMSNLLVPIGAMFAERTLYLPSVWVCLAAGLAFEQLARSLRPRLADVLLAVVVLAFGLLTAERNLTWIDAATLWADTVTKVPGSGLAHANLALSLRSRGDREGALRELRTAVGLDPSRVDFRRMLAAWTDERAP